MPWAQNIFFEIQYSHFKNLLFYVSTHKYNFIKIHKSDHIIYIWIFGAVFFSSLPIQLGFPLSLSCLPLWQISPFQIIHNSKVVSICMYFLQVHILLTYLHRHIHTCTYIWGVFFFFGHYFIKKYLYYSVFLHLGFIIQKQHLEISK